MANTITFFRMAAGIVLLLCPVFSPAFFVLYIAAGLSDMLDGFVARKTDTVSELGARLDTMADFVLVVVCLIKLLPILRIPAWLYGWIGIIALPPHPWMWGTQGSRLAFCGPKLSPSASMQGESSRHSRAPRPHSPPASEVTSSALWSSQRPCFSSNCGNGSS